jgi:hypothetical protein
MARPVTLFTGQWADLPREQLFPMVKEMGYDGVELACWGDHFDVQRALKEESYVSETRALLEQHGLQCFAISNHLVGQAVCDNIDERHQAILPPHVWGDGKARGVQQRAAQEMMDGPRRRQIWREGCQRFYGLLHLALYLCLSADQSRILGCGFQRLRQKVETYSRCL